MTDHAWTALENIVLIICTFALMNLVSPWCWLLLLWIKDWKSDKKETK